MRFSRRSWVWTGVVGYVGFLAAALGLLFWARHRVLHQTDPKWATQQWQTWVEDVERQADTTGPVKRKRPQTAEPPALLLMRDLFGVCVAAVLVFSTLLFGSFWWLLGGALFSGHVPGSEAHTHDASPTGSSRSQGAEQLRER